MCVPAPLCGAYPRRHRKEDRDTGPRGACRQRRPAPALEVVPSRRGLRSPPGSGDPHAVDARPLLRWLFTEGRKLDDLGSLLRCVSQQLVRIGVPVDRTFFSSLRSCCTRRRQPRVPRVVRRGDGQTLRACIWFSDLRGCTALSNGIEPQALLDIPNDTFDTLVGAIAAVGGRVLAFIGDGLLAVFIDDEASTACRRFLRAVRESQARLASHRHPGFDRARDDVAFASDSIWGVDRYAPDRH